MYVYVYIYTYMYIYVYIVRDLNGDARHDASEARPQPFVEPLPRQKGLSKVNEGLSKVNEGLSNVGIAPSLCRTPAATFDGECAAV